MAGAWGALITDAVQMALVRDPRVVQVGLDLDRLDPHELKASTPDILISAAHSHLIGPAELAVPRLGAIGIHPSLLPRYRGSHPLWWALKNGESEAGITIYKLDAEIDTGPILVQRSVPILEGDTFLSLYMRVVPLIPSMLGDLFAEILELGRIPAGAPQDGSQATFYRAPTPKDMATPFRDRAVRRISRALATFRERIKRLFVPGPAHK